MAVCGPGTSFAYEHVTWLVAESHLHMLADAFWESQKVEKILKNWKIEKYEKMSKNMKKVEKK